MSSHNSPANVITNADGTTAYHTKRTVLELRDVPVMTCSLHWVTGCIVARTAHADNSTDGKDRHHRKRSAAAALCRKWYVGSEHAVALVDLGERCAAQELLARDVLAPHLLERAHEHLVLDVARNHHDAVDIAEHDVPGCHTHTGTGDRL